MGIAAETASATRMRILFEPESAHARAGVEFCVMTVVSKVLFLSFKLELRLDDIIEFACETTALLSRPPSQDFVLPPGGDDPFFAVRCAWVYFAVSLSIVLQRSPLWYVVP